jgi:ribosome maturation factor RimP
MILKEEISNIAKVKAKELEGYIVDVTVSSNNDIVVYFDSKEGVKIDQCVLISKYINENFDREIEDYALTVCSPGLSNPFKVKDQYINNQGKEVTVKKNDGKRISGILKKYDKQLTLEVKKKKKGSKVDYIINDIIIPFEQIKETKLKINFK